MVVVIKRDPLRFERLTRFVQALCQLPHAALVGIVEAVHPGDYNFIRAEAFCLFDHRIRLALQTAKVGVQADDGQAALSEQRMPVQLPAVSRGHPGSAGHKAHHPRRGMDHKAVEFNAIITGGLDSC